MQFLTDFALFALKTAFISTAILIVAGFLFQFGSKSGGSGRTRIEVEKLNTRFRAFRRRMQAELLGKKELKALGKSEKKEDKKANKKAKGDATEPRLFVLDFDGDIRASATESLREEITAILTVAKEQDEVLLRLESGGGLVTSYGLAASQLARLRAAKIKLTISVDKVAASGGYMMACVGDKIIAAPFAILGSIGVIAQVPNFNKLIKRADIDYREVTAGEFKRTVTMFGEITPPGMEKFREQIQETHELFKTFVKQNRPSLDIAKVATGEHWYGTQALGLGLCDELSTSDDYLYHRFETTDVYKVRFVQKKKLMDRLSESASATLFKTALRLWTEVDKGRFGR